MATKILNRIDRWGTVILIYLLPWQARLIFRQGMLAGAPSEPQTVSLYAVEVLLWVMLMVRVSAMLIEKDQIRRSRCYSLRSTGHSLLAFGALVVLAIFSVIVSPDRGATIFAAQHLAEGLIVFFLVMTAPSEREARLAFVMSAVVQALIAIMQVAFQRVYPDTWLGIAAHFPQLPGASVVEAAGVRLLRAYGSLPHPNILGGFMAVAILAARPLFRRASLLGWAAYFVLGVGLFFSFSRLAWLAVIIGLVGQWAYARRDLVFVKLAPAALLAMVIGAVCFWPFVAARTTVTGRLEVKSVTSRLNTYRDAFELIVRHPLAGVGAGAFTAALSKEVAPLRQGYDLEPAHSAPLAVWAELGIFGLLIYLYLLWLSSHLAWKSGRLGLGLTLIALATLDHWSWTTYAGIIIFWAGWGLTLRGCKEDGVTHKAGAIIISKNDPGKILLLYRDGPNYCDWTFPKGHMEPGESREDTAKREVMEETGLAIAIIKTLPDRGYHTFSGSPAIAHYFLARSLDDAPLRLESGFPKNRLEWISIDEAEGRLSFDNMKEYFRGIKDIVKAGKK